MDFYKINAEEQPNHWLVAFYDKASSPFLNRIVPGRFKHVAAIGFYPSADAFLLFSAQAEGVLLVHYANTVEGRSRLGALTQDAVVLRCKAGAEPMGAVGLHRIGFTCVAAVKHLLRERCAAITPSALYRHLLREGGIPIDGRQAEP